MKPVVVDVVEFTDPLCSVAWGAEPIFRQFRWRYGHVCNWRTVMGGLAGDLSTGVPDWTRGSAAVPMEKYWRRVTKVTGQPYPKPMHVMLRSTDPAGRAVKAAALQVPRWSIGLCVAFANRSSCSGADRKPRRSLSKCSRGFQVLIRKWGGGMGCAFKLRRPR